MSDTTPVRTDRFTQVMCLLGWTMVSVLALMLMRQMSPPVIEACYPGTASKIVAPPFNRNPPPEK